MSIDARASRPMLESAGPSADRAVRVDLPRDCETGRPTVAIVHKTDIDDSPGLELLRHIRELGWTPVSAYDGDPQGLEADVLLMPGHGRMFMQYAAQLRRLQRHGQRRPRTVLWQIDPYPPPVMPERAARWMRRAAGAWGVVRWLERGLVMMPLGTRVKLARNVGRALIGPMVKAAADDLHRRGEGALADVDYKMLRYGMECEHWVRTAVREGWLDAMFVSTMQKREHLAKLGIEATFVPVGYAPGLGEDRGHLRDLDVVFLGTVRQGLHRERMLSKLAPELARRGLRLEVVTGNCLGEARTELLNRAKILLHLHQYPWDTPWVRFTMGMSNGALMVSEPLSDPRPFEPGVHYIEGDVEQLPTLIERYAADASARQGIIANARELIERDLTMRHSVSTILRSGRQTA